MASLVQIQCINKSDRLNPFDSIDFFGGVNPDGSHWKQSLSQMIELIESGNFAFFVNVNGNHVDVIISTSASGNKYLRTIADGDIPNNLLSLPECP